MNTSKKKIQKKGSSRKAPITEKLVKAVLFTMMAAFGLYAWNKITARSTGETLLTKVNNLAEDTWTNVKINPKFVSDPSIENILMTTLS